MSGPNIYLLRQCSCCSKRLNRNYQYVKFVLVAIWRIYNYSSFDVRNLQSLATWVECETIYLWSFCVGGHRFAPRLWHYSRRSFSSSQATARFSQPNMPYILNLFTISLPGEAVNYRPYASPSFEVASHVANCHFGHYYYNQTIQIFPYFFILIACLPFLFGWRHLFLCLCANYG